MLCAKFQAHKSKMFCFKLHDVCSKALVAFDKELLLQLLYKIYFHSLMKVDANAHFSLGTKCIQQCNLQIQGFKYGSVCCVETSYMFEKCNLQIQRQQNENYHIRSQYHLNCLPLYKCFYCSNMPL